MTLVNAESMRRFDEDDLEFAEQVAARAAIGVENARLATARQTTANTLQRSLLPDAVPPIEGWSIATLYRAARAAEEVEVGGDFYDFYRGEDGWIVLLGDVTGKGVEAAALTSLVRHGARFLSRYERSPSRILAGLNEALREQPGLWLCTALCARLHRREAIIASAGHPPALVVRDDGRVREIGALGPILGAWSGRGSADRSVSIGADETLFLYTDGVIDAPGEEERFGPHRLKQLLREHAGCAPEELLARLEAALDRFQVGSRADDTAALALRPVSSRAAVEEPPHASRPATPYPSCVLTERSRGDGVQLPDRDGADGVRNHDQGGRGARQRDVRGVARRRSSPPSARAGQASSYSSSPRSRSSTLRACERSSRSSAWRASARSR